MPAMPVDAQAVAQKVRRRLRSSSPELRAVSCYAKQMVADPGRSLRADATLILVIEESDAAAAETLLWFAKG